MTRLPSPPMPTYDREPHFLRDWDRLTRAQQARFMAVIPKFVGGLVSGDMPAGLRVKRVQGTDDDFEMTWAPDGRATFRYGNEVRPGDPHIIWLRIGTHAIFD